MGLEIVASPIDMLEAKFQSLTSTSMGASGSSTFICSVSLKFGLSEPLATLVFTLEDRRIYQSTGLPDYLSVFTLQHANGLRVLIHAHAQQ